MLAIALGTGLMALSAGPAFSAAPTLRAGMVVRDPAGGQVGTIDSVTSNGAVIATGTHKVALPASSFGTGNKGPVIAMTRAELDAVAAKAAADAADALRARLLPGVAVFGSEGNGIGTIKMVDGDFVVLTTASGEAKLPIAAVGSGAKGLTVGMSASDFQAALGKTS